MPYPVILRDKKKELGRPPVPDDFSYVDKWKVLVALKKCIMQTKVMLETSGKYDAKIYDFADQISGLEDEFENYALSIQKTGDEVMSIFTEVKNRD